MRKVVLITGGAGGIGSAIALELAKEGYDIAINYLHSEGRALELKKMMRFMNSMFYLTRITVFPLTKNIA